MSHTKCLDPIDSLDKVTAIRNAHMEEKFGVCRQISMSPCPLKLSTTQLTQNTRDQLAGPQYPLMHSLYGSSIEQNVDNTKGEHLANQGPMLLGESFLLDTRRVFAKLNFHTLSVSPTLDINIIEWPIQQVS